MEKNREKPAPRATSPTAADGQRTYEEGYAEGLAEGGKKGKRKWFGW